MTRKIVVLFSAGKGERAGRFRHVVGTNVIEVADTDALGAPRWSECGQARSPLQISELVRHALERVCSCLVRRETTVQEPETVLTIGEHLEIYLGEASLYGCRS